MGEVGTSALLKTWAKNGLIELPSDTKIGNGWDVGEQPPAEYANWVLNEIGKSVNHILQNGVPLHNTETDYVTGNICQVAGTMYKAKQDNTNSVPPNNNWQQVAPYPVKNSVTIDDGALQLVNDDDEPGANKYYGTDANSAKGFHTVVINGFETGDIKLKYGSGVLDGYVRFNDRTIGSAASNATERANADVEDLFKYIWAADANIVIGGGRGASADADWAADKTMTLPDAKGRALIGLDGMGGAVTNRVNAIGDGNPGFDATALGAAGGADRHQLTEDELAEHRHKLGGDGNEAAIADFPNTSGVQGPDGQNDGTQLEYSNNTGGDKPHNNVQPSIVIGTVYIKL